MSSRKSLIAAALSCLLCASAAGAETLSYADAVGKLSQDCGADIKKLCSGLNLGSGRIADCLQQNASKVSATCKGSVGGVMTSIKQRQDAQSAYSKVCSRDMSRRCEGVVGDGYILACLSKPGKRISEECSKVITDAGWR